MAWLYRVGKVPRKERRGTKDTGEVPLSTGKLNLVVEVSYLKVCSLATRVPICATSNNQSHS